MSQELRIPRQCRHEWAPHPNRILGPVEVCARCPATCSRDAKGMIALYDAFGTIAGVGAHALPRESPWSDIK